MGLNPAALSLSLYNSRPPNALSLSCTADARVFASSGAAVAAHIAGKRRVICNRRVTALVLFGPGGSAAGSKPGRDSFSE
jgi:hypothetical protein